MDHSKKNTYLFSIDALRVLAILAVILIHSTTKTLATLDHNVSIAPFSLFLNQASRFAVPLFFLISGFVLELNNKTGISYLNFFKKRASRIIAPFVFWSGLYFYVGWGYNLKNLVSIHFLQDLLFGTASYHLYFIPTLILFYLSFPVLHNAISFLKKPAVLIIIGLIQLALLTQDYYIKQLPLHYDLRIALLSISMFINGMAASYYSNVIFLFVKKYFFLVCSLLLVVLGFIFIHVYTMTMQLHTSGFIYNQYSPFNYLYTILLTVVLFYLFEKTQFFRKFFIGLSKLSFFVFFIHVLVLDRIWEGVVKNLVMQNGKGILTQLWFDPVLFLSIALISFTIAYGIHKIPFAPKITG